MSEFQEKVAKSSLLIVIINIAWFNEKDAKKAALLNWVN